jgi:hypothetical protein
MEWAKVLRMRMLERDSSKRSFTDCIAIPDFGRSCVSCSKKLGVMDSKTASSTEQRNETPMAIAK